MSNPGVVAKDAMEGRIKADETRALESDIDTYVAATEQRVEEVRAAIQEDAAPGDAARITEVWNEIRPQLEAASMGAFPLAASAITMPEYEPIRGALTTHIIDFFIGLGIPQKTIDERLLADAFPDMARALQERDFALANAVIAKHNLNEVRTGGTNFVAPREY